jgi:hypothetical protein
MHKPGHKSSRKRTMRKHKGGYYGMSGAIAPGAALWTRGSEMGDWAVSNRGANAQCGAGKKRKSKKTMKKGRKHRGGGRFGGVSASYQGTGSRGLADFKGIVTRDGSGAAAQGAFNNFGAQPGSGFGNFIKAN